MLKIAILGSSSCQRRKDGQPIGALGAFAPSRTLGLLLFLLTVMAPGIGQTAPLKPGDGMPQLAGRTLAGKHIDGFAPPAGAPSVEIFAFSHADGQVAEEWASHLTAVRPQLRVDLIIFLEAVPRLIRGLVISKLSGTMPPGLQQHTLLVFHDEAEWQQRLDVHGKRGPSVLLLDAAGRLRWMYQGPYSRSTQDKLLQQIP
jgi:hypothetical protein